MLTRGSPVANKNILCSCHVTYVLQSESTLYSCLNVKELHARSRCKIWSLSDLVSVRLRTKWFWVRVQLQSGTRLFIVLYVWRKKNFVEHWFLQTLKTATRKDSFSTYANFPKMNIFTRWYANVRTCAYQGVKILVLRQSSRTY